MALVLKDRVRETTIVLGTADATLLGAVTGYQAFSVIGNGNTCYYTIADSAGNWEVGIGTYSTTGPTLARTTVVASSNAGAKVTFPAGTKDVFVTYPAEYAAYVDGANIVPGTASTVPTTYGGTGQSSYTAGDLPYYASGTSLSKLGIGTSGYVLKSTGSAPSWDAVSNVAVTTFSGGTTGLTPASATAGAITLAGTLALANGGTGKTTAPAALANLLGLTTTATGGATTTLTATSTTQQLFTGTTTQTVVMPDVTTLALGWYYEINNNSTGNLTVNSSGGNLICTIYPNTAVHLMCVAITGTTAASWDYDYSGHVGAAPTQIGGTGQSTYSAGDMVYYASGSALSKLTIGTSGYVLKSNGTAPVWDVASNVAVTTISFGTTGLTPATATGGAVTVAGTLALANGGTGATTVAGAQTNLQVDPAGTAVAMAIALG